MRSRAVGLAVAAVVALLALGSAYAVQRTFGAVPDEDAGWLDSLAEVQGQWVSNVGFARDGSSPWAAQLTLAVAGDEVRVESGCNTVSIRASVDDHRLRAEGPPATTLVGCAAPASASERWLARLVSDRPQVALKGSTEGPMLTFDSDAGWIGFVRR